MILVIAAIAVGYQFCALLACLAFLLKRRKAPSSTAPVAVLRPVRGLDPALDGALRSLTEQTHPNFEILCGVSDSQDPAIPVIRKHPAIRIVGSITKTANAKVGVLIDLVREARHPILVIGDADIRVLPDYLARVTAPLAIPEIGLVTCLYRAHADSFPARFEALGISTDFAPSALVAPMVGVNDFAFGSTIAVRRADLERAGALQEAREYIADDYQIGRRIHSLGLKCVMSEVIVDTHLGGMTWRDVWTHQLRWARTIRLSKPFGYAGLPVTFATLWSAAALLSGHFAAALLVIVARMITALFAGLAVMRDPNVARFWWLIPLRDLFACAVWTAGWLGRTVEWRGTRLQLDRKGRIVPTL